MKKNQATAFLQKLPKPIRENIQVVLIGLVLVLLLVGTYVAVQLSQTEQENRQKASVANGQVLLTARQSPSPFVADGSQGQFILSANTNGVSVDGVQLTFTLAGNTNFTPISSVTVEAVPNAGVIIFGSPNISDNGTGGTVVSFAATGPTLNQPFSSSTPVDFAVVKFNVNALGPITLTFDKPNSMSLIHDSSTQEDTLNLDSLTTISQQTFTTVLAEGATPTDTPVVQPTDTLTPVPTICAQPTAPQCQSNEHLSCANQTGTAICQQCNCVANSATNTPTLTPVPTDIPGTGGTTIKYCGESCTAHSDCAVNLLCYSNVCRLANNPTDTACNNPPDNGIHRVCNEYCADSRECQTGLTCYYNRCRNPRNSGDQYCSEPIASNTKVVTKTKTVVVTASPTPTTPTKGGDETPFGSAVATEAPFMTNTPFPTYAPVAQITPEPESDQFTMVDRIQSWLKGLLIVAVAISAVFFLLWLLPLFFRKRHDDDDLPPTPMTGTGGSENSPYSDSLHDKTSGGMG